MSAEGRPDPARIEALFDALVDLDPALAKQRLDTECAEDPALREAVERLLAHDRAAAQSFLAPDADLAAEAMREAGSSPKPPDIDFRTGSPRLGRFRVLDKLGEGGMSVVYVGLDEQLHRRVALKLLRHGSATRDWLLREGQALGRLSHPNVVAVHEIGEHEGRVFLAMELVPGPTLSRWLAAEPRSFADIIRVFLQAGRGLSAAHEAGLMHRDFKPDNVLVGEDGRARVVDFGIAALTEAIENQPASIAPDAPAAVHAIASTLTNRGAILGTPAFMAPEQLSGEGATAKSDQWAFCAALYCAAYGVPPFPIDDVGRLVRSVLRDPPRPPPRVAGVPGWLGPILLRGLTKQPSDRFASMRELIEAIERHLPRDRELDPAPVARQRALLSGVLVLVSAMGGAAMLTDAGMQWLTGRSGLLGVGVGMLALMVVVVAILSRKLRRTRYGRRLAGVFLVGGVALCGHRLAAVRLEIPSPSILALDLVLLSVFFAMLAVLDEGWMGWLSGTTAVAALVGVLSPERAVSAFGVAGALIAAAMSVRVGIDRRAVEGVPGGAKKKSTGRVGSSSGSADG